MFVHFDRVGHVHCKQYQISFEDRYEAYYNYGILSAVLSSTGRSYITAYDCLIIAASFLYILIPYFRLLISVCIISFVLLLIVRAIHICSNTYNSIRL